MTKARDPSCPASKRPCPETSTLYTVPIAVDTRTAVKRARPPDLTRWQQWIGLDISGGAEEARFLLRGTVESVQSGNNPF